MINIRRAKNDENNILTEISFASKHYWNYPEEYFEIWRDELTISQSYINENRVFVVEYKERVIGYFSIIEVKEDFWAGKVFVKQGFWLEHIFIVPDYIKKGIGSKLIKFATKYCKENNIGLLNIFSDPNAKGFYEKIGAKYISEYESSIENRTVFLYEYAII